MTCSRTAADVVEGFGQTDRVAGHRAVACTYCHCLGRPEDTSINEAVWILDKKLGFGVLRN